MFRDGLPMNDFMPDLAADSTQAAHPTPWDFDSIPPEYLEAMEVYQGLGTPIQYGPACGVVLFWSR